MLGKIKTAAVPDSFSQKFVEETLLMKGGTAKATMPFLKKMKFVADDGKPTELYAAFRNDKKSGGAIAQAMNHLYQSLFKMNVAVQSATDAEVRGLIVESTGGEKDSVVTKFTLQTFKALKKLADFDQTVSTIPLDKDDASDEPGADKHDQHLVKRFGLSYTINLNLPPTRDIEVFNAIFKSLKNHLLDQ